VDGFACAQVLGDGSDLGRGEVVKRAQEPTKTGCVEGEVPVGELPPYAARRSVSSGDQHDLRTLGYPTLSKS
jgi:hypothetical protein